MTFTRSRAFRIVLRLVGAVVALVVLFVCWALFWPAPGNALKCRGGDPPGCRAAAGRVVYIPSKDRSDRSRPLHLVLLSRDSVALPLITLVKIPAAKRPPGNPGVGRWVSVVGTTHKGSNGRTDIGVSRFAMP